MGHQSHVNTVGILGVSHLHLHLHLHMHLHSHPHLHLHPQVVKYGRYTWCGCGLARTEQPLCDKTCMNLNMAKLVKTGPVEYVAPKDGEVWFCNCKQTNNRPFCDGSHRSEEVQNHRFDHRPQFWEPRVSRKKSVAEE